MKFLMHCLILLLPFAPAVALAQAQAQAQEGEPVIAAAAAKAARNYLLIDTHIDVPERLEGKWADVTGRVEDGDFDYERARRGGLDIPFMSIYTPGASEAQGTSYELANRLIDRVEALVGRAPGKFAIVRSPDEALAAKERGLIGLAMGMENGSPIDGKLENLAFFRDRGVSYVTLTHSLSNHIADSSYDEHRQWNGLSPFGRELVAEMNRLGVMVDVSHVSDEAFYQVLELSRAPVIASHSSARHFTPGFERNMSDEMIRALANKGGIIMINFGSSFLTAEAQQWFVRMVAERKAWLRDNGFDEHGPEASEFGKRFREQNPFPYASLDDLVAHFTHVIDLVGIDHVGIGSDFDGVGDSLPEGMKDVSFYPNLVEKLMQKGHSAEDIEAILGGNLMRVWRAVQANATPPVAG
ncbi:MAG TPA: dipeptidase [Afifellaceae bacterium]|nr:dipeptidase [Afifellaceae bacterium]